MRTSCSAQASTAREYGTQKKDGTQKIRNPTTIKQTHTRQAWIAWQKRNLNENLSFPGAGTSPESDRFTRRENHEAHHHRRCHQLLRALDESAQRRRKNGESPDPDGARRQGGMGAYREREPHSRRRRTTLSARVWPSAGNHGKRTRPVRARVRQGFPRRHKRR